MLFRKILSSTWPLALPFAARVELREFGEGGVFAHEKTLDAPREDRYRLLAGALLWGFVVGPVREVEWSRQSA